MIKFIFPIFLSLFFFKNYKYLITFLNLILITFLIKTINTNFLISINNNFLLDKISLIIIILSLIRTLLIILSSSNYKNISLLIILILLFLILTFSFKRLILFYISFEIILIPTLILITKNGNQPERLQAGIYLLIYTILASLPLLIGILFIKNFSNFIFLQNSNFTTNFPLIFLLAFFAKLPIFFFHLWLPKAHVEAPVEGSIILAAVLLKLGSYGIIRFLIIIINKINKFNYWIIRLRIIGATATSLNCIRQKDLKSLIAYSSVAHIGFLLSRMITLNKIGLYGSLIIIIGHGFSSSRLFLLVNIIYTKYHTRNIISFKGLINSFPNIIFWWFIFIAINISAPPSINLISEIFIISRLINFNITITLIIFLLSLTSASFSIFIFINIAHNITEILPRNQSYSKLFLSLSIHLIPLIFISIKLELILF